MLPFAVQEFGHSFEPTKGCDQPVRIFPFICKKISRGGSP